MEMIITFKKENQLERIHNINMILVITMEDFLIAMVPKGDPISNNRSIHISDLKNRDLIVMNQGSTVYQMCAEACHKLNFEMKVLYSDQHVSNLADFVVKGIGTALLMKGLTRFIRNPNSVVLPIVPRIQGNLFLCWQTNAKLSSAAQKFISLVEKFQSKPDLEHEKILDFKPPLF
ncbi:MAG: LysR substrate-binding domain-containing protein [Bacilli bacterium]|jgi:DNA-binding transcriptional LysR family regulator